MDPFAQIGPFKYEGGYTYAQGRHSCLLKRNQQKEAFHKQETENIEVESKGGEQQGMVSQSCATVERHVQTDLAARDIECLCQQSLDTQVLSEKLKYHVFDVDSAASDETRLSFYTGLPGDIVD